MKIAASEREGPDLHRARVNHRQARLPAAVVGVKALVVKLVVPQRSAGRVVQSQCKLILTDSRKGSLRFRACLNVSTPTYRPESTAMFSTWKRGKAAAEVRVAPRVVTT